MHQRAQLNRRVSRGTLVRLERSAGKLARSVLRGERSREAPDLPGGVSYYAYLSSMRRATCQIIFRLLSFDEAIQGKLPRLFGDS